MEHLPDLTDYERREKTSTLPKPWMQLAGEVGDLLGSKDYAAFAKAFESVSPLDYKRLRDRARFIASVPESEVKKTRKAMFFGGKYKQIFG